MKSLFLAAAAVSIMCLAIPPPASAQQACPPREEVIDLLEGKYGEQAIGRGLSLDGKGLAELFVNEETGTWSIVVTDTNGRSCIVGGGEAWQKLLPSPESPEGDPA